MRQPTSDQRQKHANNQGDSNHDDRNARDAVRMFGDRRLVYVPKREAADEYDRNDVDGEIYECVHHGDPHAAAIEAGLNSQSRQKSLNRVVLNWVYRVVCVIETWPSQSWIALVSMPSLASL